MDKSPLVSIIIPCYNAEKWVAEAIQSAVDQTWPNKEVIVIDDGSTDGSLEVVKSFGERVRWETGPNRGGCAARNWGASIARGAYLSFLDADDIIAPDKIQYQMDRIAGTCSIASTCRLISTKEPGKDDHHLPSMDDSLMHGHEFLVNWHAGILDRRINPEGDHNFTFGNSSSWILSREVFEKAGGWNENLAMCQDSEFFARVAFHCEQIDINAKAYGYYRIGGAESVSLGYGRRKAESFLEFCRKAEELLIATRLETCRRAIVTNYFSFIQRFYPHHPDLITMAFSLIQETGLPVTTGIKAPRLRLACRLIGVRAALRLQKYLRR